MMLFCMDGSDINRLALAAYEWHDRTLSDNGWRRSRETVVETGPEGYLAAVDAFIKPEEIDGIVVVQGPGSATALRASLAIANTIAAVRKIKLYGIAKGISWDAVFVAEGPTDGVNFLAPVYEHDPRITPSSRDDLRRKV